VCIEEKRLKKKKAAVENIVNLSRDTFLRRRNEMPL
jgi:hypothetical protein